MNAAAAAIRAMSAEQIAQYEREKAITVSGVEYLEGEIKVGPVLLTQAAAVEGAGDRHSTCDLGEGRDPTHRPGG